MSPDSPPGLPVPVEWRENGLPQRHLAVGTTTMGVLMAAAMRGHASGVAPQPRANPS